MIAETPLPAVPDGEARQVLSPATLDAEDLPARLDAAAEALDGYARIANRYTHAITGAAIDLRSLAQHMRGPWPSAVAAAVADALARPTGGEG